MPPENIDDLFRRQLDEHASAPSPDLWARLQALPPAEDALPAPPAAETTPEIEAQRLDERFRQGLHTHATPVPRQLWERLEDEHLRPRKRRAAAWWPLAVAAVVALFIVAGGVLVWSGGVLRPGRSAGQLATGENPAAATLAATNKAGQQVAATAKKAAELNKKPASEKNNAAQATRLAAVSSSAPESHQPVTTTTPAPRFGQSVRPAYSAAATAMLTPARVRRSGPTAPRHPGAPAHSPATGAAQVAVAPARQPSPAAATSQAIPAAPTPPTDVASTGITSTGIIEVEVYRGGSPAATRPAPAAVAVAAAPAAEPREPRSGVGRQLGSLFSRANGAVRLAKSGLAVAQNIPDNLTVQAHLGSRTLSKTIDL